MDITSLKSYSIIQAHEISGISVYGIRKAISDGQLKAIRVGSGEKAQYRISAINLEKFLNGED